ncbi:MAG: TetR/AcrR family transcriptional regulator [Eubacteriales bacterium]
MPKTFSDSEREYIKKRLIEETSDCLSLYGIRKTTVDEIVKRVGIPKGTFYLFYESKESLIFDVILSFNAEVQGKLVAQVEKMSEKPDAEALTDIIFGLYQSVKKSFLMKIMVNGELDFFMRKAPPEYNAQHAAEDDFMLGQLIELFPTMDAEKSSIYSGALRGAFLVPMYEKELNLENFDETLRLMIRGIVIQMFGG